MGSSKTAPWVLGTAFAAVLILIGAWLLVISPKMASASDKREQAQSEQARIDQVQIQLVGLKHDFENIGVFRGKLKDLQVQIPTDEELSTLVRQLSTIATETGVALTSVAPNSPTAVVQAGSAAPAAGTATTDSASAAGTPSETTPQTGQTAGAQAVRGFYAIPIDIIVVGSYANTVKFLAKLQTGSPRLVLVSELHATSQKAAGAQAGLPALADGDLQLTFTAYAFSLVDSLQPSAQPTQPATPAPLPVPAAQPNPFVPLH